MKVYRIRNKETGLYSTGGRYIGWSRNGKIWKNIGHLKNHLLMFKEWNNKWDLPKEYNNAEIIVYDLIETRIERDSFDLGDLIKQLTD